MITLLFLSLLLLIILVLVVVVLIVRIVIVFRTIQRNRCRRTNHHHRSSDWNDCLNLRLNHRQHQQQQQQQQSQSSSSSSSSKPIPQQPQKPPLRTLIVLGSGGHTSEMLYMTQFLNQPFHSPNNNNNNNHGSDVIPQASQAPPPQQQQQQQPVMTLFHPIYYCKASTDTTSKDRLWHHHSQQQQLLLQQQSPLQQNTTSSPSSSPPSSPLTTPIEIYDIPRSREVGQSYMSSIVTTSIAIYVSTKLLYQLRPHVIICNGPGTCIPICIIAFLFRILHILPNHQTTIVFIESFCRVQTLSLTGKVLYHFNMTDLFMVHWTELHQLYPRTIVTNTYLSN